MTGQEQKDIDVDAFGDDRGAFGIFTLAVGAAR